MRSYNFFCRSVTIFLKTSKYEKKIYKNIKTHLLLEATNDIRIIWKISERLLKKIYVSGFLYNKVGVILSDFYNENCMQNSLLPDQEDMNINNQVRNKELMKTVDSINKRFGDGKLRLSSDINGSFYLKKKNVKWLMKSEYQSPNYTTDWVDIPKVKI